MRRILWFRRDLRSDDHPLLALEGEVLPIFIFDPTLLDPLKPDDRRVSFIWNALIRLKTDLRKRGLDIALFYGRPETVFEYLLEHNRFDEVCASGDYDSYALERDRAISHRIHFRLLQDTYLFGPEEVLKNDGTPYLVFTPFYRRAKELLTPSHLDPLKPASQTLIPNDFESIIRIDETSFQILPMELSSLGFESILLSPSQLQTPGEKLDRFSPLLNNYPNLRDYPANKGTSELSTDLRFGTISIRTLLRWLAERKREGMVTEPFFRELMFREFYAMLLHHFPNFAWENFRTPFTGIWDENRFAAFCSGRTGVPIVDAGIRQLLETGEMHNRVRMIAASFFTKNLLLPWQRGEAFFAAHLMDYDAASNILSWQWSAGTGIDPQPYFRIFNPWLQAKKYDPEGEYIRTWVPELHDVPGKILHDEAKMAAYRPIQYPPPLVDHRSSSERALAHFRTGTQPNTFTNRGISHG